MHISQLTMGGYGAYVWSAYGIGLSVFLINFWLVINTKRQIKKLFKRIHHSE